MNLREIEASLQDLFDGGLDDESFHALQQELKVNQEARLLYRDYALLEHSLRFRGKGVDLLKVVPMEQVVVRQQRRFMRVAMIGSAAAVVVLSLLLSWFLVPKPTLTFEVSPGTEFAVSHKKGSDQDTPKGRAMADGSRLVVTKGNVEVEFSTGVRGIIQSPADLTLVNKNQVRLKKGTVWFEVPRSARGFQVSTTSLVVTDLGTQFGVRESSGALPQVHVFKGEVFLENLMGEGGEKTLVAGNACFADTDGGWVETEIDPGSFLTELPMAADMGPALIQSDFQSETVSGDWHEGPRILPISGDLLETSLLRVSGSKAAVSGAKEFHDVQCLTNGRIEAKVRADLAGQSADLNPSVSVFSAGKRSFVEFVLDTRTHPKGFDIESLQTISRWRDARSQQSWKVFFKKVGGDFVEIYHLSPTTGAGLVTCVTLEDPERRIMASEVEAIRFEFGDIGSLNWTAYREIDVVGTPTKP